MVIHDKLLFSLVVRNLSSMLEVVGCSILNFIVKNIFLLIKKNYITKKKYIYKNKIDFRFTVKQILDNKFNKIDALSAIKKMQTDRHTCLYLQCCISTKAVVTYGQSIRNSCFPRFPS
jgi:hypothetical protein